MLFVLFAFLMVVIVRGLKEDGYKLQALQVPQNLEKAGYNGQVLALMMQDRVHELKMLANSRRDDSLDINVDVRPDLNLDVMGVGLSATSMIYHIKELLGRTTYTIGGNLLDLEQVLTLNVRMTDQEPFSAEVPYEEGRSREAINEIVDLGAKYVLGKTDPYRLAICYEREGDIPKSEDLIRKIIRDRPQDRKWAYNFWANIKHKLGDREKSYQYHRKAIEEDKDFILPIRGLAWKLHADKKYEEALAYFLRALEIDPKERSMDTGAAHCYRAMGKLDEADYHYRAFIEKFPENLYGYGNYSDFLMRYKEDTIGSADIWRQASENMGESGDLYLAQAAFQVMKGDSVEALRLGLQALDLEPDNIAVLTQMSKVYYNDIKDYNQSIIYSKRLVKLLEEESYDAWMIMSSYNYLALAEYEIAAYDSSIVHAKKAISYMPDNPFPWSTLAEAHLLKGDLDAFYEAIEKAISLGFDMDSYLNQHPYDRVKDQSRLRRMITIQKKQLALSD